MLAIRGRQTYSLTIASKDVGPLLRVVWGSGLPQSGFPRFLVTGVVFLVRLYIAVLKYSSNQGGICPSLDECLADDHLHGHFGQFTSLPGFHFGLPVIRSKSLACFTGQPYIPQGETRSPLFGWMRMLFVTFQSIGHAD